MKNPIPKISKVVIPAAGLGTRFLPVTMAVPKELLPIVDKPTIQYIVEEAVESGIREIILITNEDKELIIDYFNKIPDSFKKKITNPSLKEELKKLQKLQDTIKIVSIHQRKTLGLGHAIYQARVAVGNEPFAVILGDDIVDAEPKCLKQMIDCYSVLRERQETDAISLVALKKVLRRETKHYGIIQGKKFQISKFKPRTLKVWMISDLIEKPSPEKAPSRLAVIGRYILPPDIFDILEKLKPGKGGEIQLTDALKILASSSQGDSGVYGLEFIGDRYDAGDKFGFLEVNIAYALKRKDMRSKLLKKMQTILSNRSKI